MGSGRPHRSGIHGATQASRRVPLHPNGRTNDYLRCLSNGAVVADPGDLDPVTRAELARLTHEGSLMCVWRHGRKEWRRK
jgi:hypothetical protein